MRTRGSRENSSGILVRRSSQVLQVPRIAWHDESGKGEYGTRQGRRGRRRR